MKSSNSTAIVVLNWNCADTIIACIESVAAQTAQHNIVLVDNDSRDNSVAMVQAAFPDVVVIKNDHNKGFSGGVNPGINYSMKQNYTYTALLNPDATIAPGWIVALEKTMDEKQDVGIAASKLIDPRDGTIDTAGDAMSDWLLPFIIGAGQPGENYNEGRYVPSGCAGGSLYRNAMFEDIGVFDETYFVYYEDTDFSLRAQLSGWRSYYEPSAVGYHTRSTSGKKVPGIIVQQSIRNRYLLVVKNTPMGALLRHGYKFAIAVPLFFLNDVRKGQGWNSLKSVFGMVAITPYALRSRRAIMKNKAITNQEFIERTLFKGAPPNIKPLRILGTIFK